MRNDRRKEIWSRTEGGKEGWNDGGRKQRRKETQTQRNQKGMKERKKYDRETNKQYGYSVSPYINIKYHGGLKLTIRQ
jgi:hypothetical protein